MGPRAGLNVLDKRKITSNYQNSNLGLPSPLPPNSTALHPGQMYAQLLQKLVNQWTTKLEKFTKIYWFK
jgi:hypothetical protein